MAEALFAVALPLLAWVAAVEAPPGQQGPGPASVAAAGAQDLAPEVRRAREQLRSGGGDVPVLAIHARTLLDAGDLITLHEVLLGSEPPRALAVLKALQTTEHAGLVPELLAVATSHPAADVALAARTELEREAALDPTVVQRLVEWLGDGALPPAQLDTIVAVLGRSRDLAAVEPLITELEGPRAASSQRALEILTGTSREGREGWTAFWAENRRASRDELLERALERERAAAVAERTRMLGQVVTARLASIGSDVSLLIGALTDEYEAVRLEAARRLGTHANLEQAAGALPGLLARLGTPKPVGSEGDPNASRETDPAVRAALIAALGVLGRDDPRVRQTLLAELAAADDATAAVTVEAFARVRERPEVVAPLLSFLARRPTSEDTIVTVLGVVAANQPQGVLDELSSWLTAERAPRVRAAGVQAVLACAELEAALDAVAGLASQDEARDVHYALAVALGDRLRKLPADARGRSRMLDLLRQLLDDADPSVRAAAAVALGETGEDVALAILEQRARAETDGSVMERILAALGRLGRLEGVDTIGRVCVGWKGESFGALEQAARRALESIAGGAPAETWLGMATTLEEVSAYGLAAWVLQQTLLRHETNGREVAARVRGKLAEVLVRAGQIQEAYDLLVQLHETSAPFPPTDVRLELLANTSEQLRRPGEAADWWLRRLAQLAVGERSRGALQRRAAQALVAARRWEEAKPLLDELLDKDESDNELMLDKARVHRALGEDEVARVTLHRLLHRVPESDQDLRAAIQEELDSLGPAPEGAERP